MVNPAFDTGRPAEGWEHRGLVIRSHASDNFNAIDPFRIDTFDGKSWLAFGSWWDGIRLIELDPASGLKLGDAPPLPIASRGGGAIEAPSILHRGDWYYLFASFDLCCRGTASTYRIMVGRSGAVTGPYADKDGKPMLEGGGTQLLATDGRRRGPGGQEAFMVGDEYWLAWHYYDRNNGGQPRLQIARLHFTDDGWPFLDPVPAE
jgi:arabinan endo-1,5-alpha-L-arabinosidase